MNFPQLPGWLELPLLKRELIENSHKKRTYVLRILVALIFMLVMLVFYSQQIARHNNVLQVMGRGRALAAILLVCNLVAIYALLPAMACSAISSEREKQTLSLILITRITPGGLILEKFLSRLVPMIALMLITLPMLSIAYMLGGLRLESVFAALIGLFTAAVQVNSAAIMCSALFRTALEAFWATHLLFAVMGLGPPILYEFDLLPHINWFPGVGNEAIAMPFVLFLGMSVGAIEGFASIGYVLLSSVPPLIVAVVMLVIGRFAIAHGQQDAPVNLTKFARFGRRVSSSVFRRIMFRGRKLSQSISGTTHADDLPYMEVERRPRPFPVTQPIAWRERQVSALSNWRLHAVVLCAMVVFEWGWFFVETGNHGDEISVIFDFGFYIISLLMVIGVTCRMFASERERQTLDLLLTTPLTNRELLNEKMSAANHTILFLMAPIFFAAMTHLVIGDVRVRATYNTTYSYYPTRIVQFYESEWWFTAVRYLFGHLTHAILYLTLVKWIAVLFSLKLNSQMKAMLGTIVTVLGLCIVPAMLSFIPFLFLGQNPEQAGYQIWFMTSPVFAFLFNEVHELSVMTRNGWWLDSEYITLLVNLAIYGALTLAVRTYVVRKLPTLLNRLDSETSDEHAG